MKKTAFVFPGQGSQHLGMADNWLQTDHGKALFERASAVLERDLADLVQNGPQHTLDETQWTQPALLVTSVAAWQAWQENAGTKPDFLAGHSLGEYSALVCGEALDFEDAVKLVHRRGRYMQKAAPPGSGAMAAVLGLEDDEVEAICHETTAALGSPESVSAANFNSPGQVVISGTASAVDKAAELAREAGAKRVIPLAVSVPSHCALMRPAAERLAADLEGVDIRQPTIPVIHNATAKVADSADAIRTLLAEQLHQPVRWTQTMRALRDNGIETVVECGPGKVLSGLLKRFDRRWPTDTLHSPQDIPTIRNKWSQV